MPTPRTVPTDLHALIVNTLTLYDGLFTDVTIEHQFAPDVPLVRLDPEQIRRVIINLIDNAIEAMERRGRIVGRNAVRRAESSRPRHRGRRRAGHSGGGAREAVSAVLLDEAARQRPRAGDRAAHHRGARRQHRRRATTCRAALDLQSSCRRENPPFSSSTTNPASAAR